MDAVIGQLGGLTSAQQVSDAVTGMLPLMTGSMLQVASDNLRTLNRLIQLRLEAGGASSGGLSSGDGFVTDGAVWAKPLGAWANQKSHNGTFGYDANTYGIALGADGELSPANRVGGAFAYARSNVDSKSNVQTADVDSYQVVVYGASELDRGLALNWQADYGHNKNQGDRFIALAGTTARANYSSDSFHLGAGLGRDYQMDAATRLIPSLRADYTSIHDKGYTESGAGALNLTVNGKTTDEFILSVDGKVVRQIGEKGSLFGNLGVGYDVNAKQTAITASYAGGGAAFTTEGINPSSTLVRGGAGYSTTADNGLELTARYDIEARSRFTNQSVSVKASLPF